MTCSHKMHGIHLEFILNNGSYVHVHSNVQQNDWHAQDGCMARLSQENNDDKNKLKDELENLEGVAHPGTRSCNYTDMSTLLIYSMITYHTMVSYHPIRPDSRA
jgi:hypothetical protein